jgi:hypothetical protein
MRIDTDVTDRLITCELRSGCCIDSLVICLWKRGDSSRLPQFDRSALTTAERIAKRDQEKRSASGPHSLLRGRLNQSLQSVLFFNGLQFYGTSASMPCLETCTFPSTVRLGRFLKATRHDRVHVLPKAAFHSRSGDSSVVFMQEHVRLRPSVLYMKSLSTKFICVSGPLFICALYTVVPPARDFKPLSPRWLTCSAREEARCKCSLQ